MNATKIGVLGLSLLSLLALGGCSAAGNADGSQGGTEEHVGSVTLDLTGAPLDARCAVVTTTPATGTAVSKQFALAPGQTAVFSLTGLPTGSVTMTESIYAVPCASVTATTPAAWVADPVTVTLTQGVSSSVTFTVRPATGGVATVRNNFPTSNPNPITEYLATGNGGSSYNTIVTGPDDNLWFAESAGNAQ